MSAPSTGSAHEGRIVAITGGAAGIGWSCAEAFADAGALVHGHRSVGFRPTIGPSAVPDETGLSAVTPGGRAGGGPSARAAGAAPRSWQPPALRAIAPRDARHWWRL